MVDWQKVAREMAEERQKSPRERAAGEIAQRVTASIQDREEARVSQVVNKARYHASTGALMASAGREFWAAVEEFGEAAAAGDMGALDRIHEAGALAGSVVENAAPGGRRMGIIR
ncbi:hypothetical protein [Streptomyces sp. NPDC007984]|uniref:hypothetical protein n=1 Tax=Streptomyces sp. NPDC007984 TaxID=3364801 RepID=UPI0036E15536